MVRSSTEEFAFGYSSEEQTALLLDLLLECYLVLSRPQKPPAELMDQLEHILNLFGRIE
jgi:hypothetical protein